MLLTLFVANALVSSSAPPRRASIVTGANGYVGREIVHELIKDPSQEHIICLVRPGRIPQEEAYWNGKSSCIRVMPYDMLDDGITLQKALECANNKKDYPNVVSIMLLPSLVRQRIM